MNKKLETTVYEQLLIYKLEVTTDVLAKFSVIPSNDLWLCHFGLGLYIRNNYLHTESKLYKCFTDIGITHKDDISNIIIHMWHKILIEELKIFDDTYPK